MPSARPDKHHPVVAVMRHRGVSEVELGACVGTKPDALRVLLHGHGRVSPRLRRLVAAYFDLPESVCFRPDERTQASA
jgi:hypothetical protein